VTLRRVTSLELIKVKNEKCDLFGDSHSVFVSCRNRFSQLQIIHGYNDIRQTVLLYLSIRGTIEQILVIIEAYQFCKLR
jgi:hypothetical protein